jgi:hypothetical protein
MKKVLLMLIVIVIVFSFTLPLYAAPKDLGQEIKRDTQDGTPRSETMLFVRDNISEVNELLGAPNEFKNIGQVMVWCNYNLFGIPPSK